MQRCPTCHHKFTDENYGCDLCGLSLEAAAVRDSSTFTRSLLSLGAQLNSFSQKAPQTETVVAAEREEQMVRIRR